MGDPAHLEHAAMREWLGRPLDPEAFDLDVVNVRLAGSGTAGWDGGSVDHHASG
jgi:hypothetical protein